MGGITEALSRVDHEISDLKSRYQKIYIYGAGEIGIQIYDYLYQNNCKITAFIESQKCREAVRGIRVISLEEYIPINDDESVVVVALGRKNREEVFAAYGEMFRERKFHIYELGNTISKFFPLCKMEKRMDELKKEFCPISEMNPKEWKNILVVHIEEAIGDTIWGSAFLRELRRNFPSAKIRYVITKKMVSLVKNCPYVDEIIEYDHVLRTYSPEAEHEIQRFASEKLREEYDVVFLVKGLPTYGSDMMDNVLLALYSRARVRVAHSFHVFEEEKITSGFWRELFPIMRLDSWAEHDVSKDLSLLRICGLAVEDERMGLWPGPEETRFAKRLLEGHRNCYLIALGTNGREERRSWPADRFRKLADELSWVGDKKVCYVIFGGENAVESAEVIKQSRAEIVDIAGKTTLAQSLAVMRECNMYVGADTSLMHMAAAFGLPCVELTANLSDGVDTDRSSPVRTGPWKVPYKVVYPSRNLDGCSHICLKPYAHCITQILVEDVKRAILELMK